MLNTNINSSSGSQPHGMKNPNAQNKNPSPNGNAPKKQPQNSQNKMSLPKIVVFLVLIIVAIFLINNLMHSDGKSDNSKSDQSNSSSSNSLSFDDPNLIKVGNDVETGKVRWNVMSTENIGTELQPSDSTITDKNLFTTGKFLRIRVSITNIGDADLTYNVDSLKISDSDSKEYSPSKDKSIYMASAEVPSDKPIKAGESVVIALVYDVPKSATNFNFLAFDLSSKSNKEVKGIYLGLK